MAADIAQPGSDYPSNDGARSQYNQPCLQLPRSFKLPYESAVAVIRDLNTFRLMSTYQDSPQLPVVTYIGEVSLTPIFDSGRKLWTSWFGQKIPVRHL
ncbi:hypothetical protein RRG08_063643 [Elysia crispata]|uniref:Uncharacterized protein n=1 Tax=Elysia crispata TaxID=231223 RepID=A0AAE1CTE5_9GAST|nr:hypothetical protein RRG08_063643 [Elysia crispata]